MTTGRFEDLVRGLVEKEAGDGRYSIEELANPKKTFGTRATSHAERHALALSRASLLAVLELAKALDGEAGSE